MRVLVVVHDAGRTGAPISLLRICRAMTSRYDVQFTFVVGRSGALLDEFRTLGNVLLAPYGRLDYWAEQLGEANAIRNAADILLARRRRFALRKALSGHDVVWSNGIVNGALLSDIRDTLRAPIVCHVHELSRFLDRYVGRAAVKTTVQSTQQWIACSRAVEAMLTDEFAVPASRIVVVPEPLPPYDEPTADPTVGQEMLQVNSGRVVVLASGTMDERKGADLFPQLAIALRRREQGDRIALRWLGTQGDDRVRKLVEGDLVASGANEFTSVVATVEDPRAALAASGIFVLLSREDPYPLVLVEAVGMGVPGIAFKGSGGGPELLEQGCGITVPYLDVDAMAAAVLELVRDPARRQLLGSRGRELGRLHSPHVLAEQVYESLCSAVPTS